MACMLMAKVLLLKVTPTHHGTCMATVTRTKVRHMVLLLLLQPPQQVQQPQVLVLLPQWRLHLQRQQLLPLAAGKCLLIAARAAATARTAAEAMVRAAAAVRVPGPLVSMWTEV